MSERGRRQVWLKSPLHKRNVLNKSLRALISRSPQLLFIYHSISAFENSGVSSPSRIFIIGVVTIDSGALRCLSYR